jgi:Na+:H+ antiporter, NhaA family
MKNKELVLNSAVIAMVLCALIVTGLVVRRELMPTRASSNVDLPIKVDGWERFLNHGTRLGPPTAAVTIIEFSDFECPFCKDHAEVLAKMHGRFGDDVAIIFRHYPLTRRHVHAFDAAMASECAGAQGRFGAYREALFRDQALIGAVSWTQFAREVHVPDTLGFEACMAARQQAPRVQLDLEAGRMIGIRATPTSIINGLKVTGAIDEERFAMLIEQALHLKN